MDRVEELCDDLLNGAPLVFNNFPGEHTARRLSGAVKSASKSAKPISAAESISSPTEKR